jgi:hypothetical protein
MVITAETFDTLFDRFLAPGAQRGPYGPDSAV